MTRFVIGFLFGALVLSAQTSSLSGVVTDSAGAVVPEAIISATNQDTSLNRRTVSDASGAYSFLQVPPGLYKIEVQKPGFRTWVTAEPIRLQIDTPASLSIKLELGQVSETVNVVGEVSAVNVENASIGNAFTETQVRQLPLQTRNIVELLSVQPGVAPTGEVLGARRDQNNVTLDGVDVNDNQNSTGFQAALPVPLDSVQEFRTTVAGQGADQGRSSGGQVSLVTKSGSNDFHGSLYEYGRYRATAANNWFSNRAGIARENLVRNQYGASFGGRLIRDRAFFFFNWEDRKDRSANAVSRTVPSDTFRQGIVKVKMSDGSIVSFTPAQVKAIDPLGLGTNSAIMNYLNAFPAGNDPQSSPDKGLNFSTLRFNAPFTLDNRAYVAKMDFNLDTAGKHTVSIRGTLADNAQTQTVAQMPGQSPASLLQDNSRGLAVKYTAVLTPKIINVFDFGYTRLGAAFTGNTDPTLTFGSLANPYPSARPTSRIAPTTNIVNDTTWNNGRHTIQFGTNMRFITNDRISYAIPTAYSFSRNTLKGLGADINELVTNAARAQAGGSLSLADGTNVTNAFGAMLGVINQYSATFQFDKNATIIPFGNTVPRSFGTNEYEFYAQDSFKIRSDLTLTYGLRYGSFATPYEKNGVELVPTVGLDKFFADRNGAQALGIPNWALPSAKITYALGGPANNAPGYYARDNNNFAPRFSVAYAPTGDNLLTKLLGKGSVIRTGAAVLFDRYGNNMVVNFAQDGSPGLATTRTQPVNTDFTTGFRWNGTSLPSLESPVASGYPYTPDTVVGGFTNFRGVSPDLRAPYQYQMNFSYARPLPGKMSLEVGYVGRLSRKGLLLQDMAQPLTQFKDPKSGQTWTQASGILRDLYESGITPAMVRANPSLIPKIPFFENMFPTASLSTPSGSSTANLKANGSASANYFNTVYGTYAGSDLDALNDMDRLRQADGNCIVVTGCNTFFALQSAGYTTWVNAGMGSFHAMQVVLRRPVANGFGYDFNWTWSHSIDNASIAESGNGNVNSNGVGSAAVTTSPSGSIQDSFHPNAFRGPSDFDIRHNITFNIVGELPFGQKKMFFGNANKVLDTIIGGWQVSSLTRYRSGLPVNLTQGGVYPTNYLSSAFAVLRPNTAMPETGVGYDQTGTPSMFRSTKDYSSFMGQYPGQVGTRGIVRGPGMFNVDLSVSKFIAMPWEGHRLQIRAEAFNAFNKVNFNQFTTSLASTSTFGQFTSAFDARVMQFALRYEF